MNKLQDMIFIVEKDFEQNLSSELDKYSIPQHRFSYSYKKKKRQILHQKSRKLSKPFFRWLLFIITFTFVLVYLWYDILKSYLAHNA